MSKSFSFAQFATTTLLLGIITWVPITANAQFAPEQVITTEGGGFRSLFTADLDNDGDQDVLSGSSYSSSVAWSENGGDGNFGPGEIISDSVANPVSLHAADLDGDSDQDVISSSVGDDKVAWYENYGGGSFGPQQIISTELEDPRTVYVSDLDGDGDQDVLSSSVGDDRVAWYANDGTGDFGPIQVITSDVVGTWSVYAADLDDDGDQDVLSSSVGDDKVAWYENYGGGSFGPQQVVSCSPCSTPTTGPTSVYAFDLDSDDDLDILTNSTSGIEKIAWFKNQGGGEFGPAREITRDNRWAEPIYAADLDGDGDNDVLSHVQRKFGIASYSVVWYENDGGGGFGPAQAIPGTAYDVQSIHVADLDGDYDLDVLSGTGAESRVAWNENQFGETTASNLVAYYPLDGDASDASGNGNDGTINGATLTTDRFGNASSAYSFDGTNDYIEVADSDQFDFTEFTISFWAKSEGGNGAVVTKGEEASSDNAQFGAGINQRPDESTGRFFVKTEDSSDRDYAARSSTIPQEGEWYFVAGRRKADGTIDIFINGMLESTVNSGITTVDSPLWIGAGYEASRSSLTNFWAGSIDEVRVYNRPLDEEEIEELYGGAPPQTGLTVLIHGANFGDGFDLVDDGLLGLDGDAKWVDRMALDIQERLGGQVYHLSDGAYEQIRDGSPSGEKILMFDWLQESVHPMYGYAEGAADVLVALLVHGAQNDEWSLDQLHVIGHSRGTIVGSEAIQRLGLLASSGETTLSIDDDIHFTPIDPHPWDDEIEDFDSPADGLTSLLSAHDNDVNGAINEGVLCWSNVGYADHYWQQRGIFDLYLDNLSGLDDVMGCDYNRSLNDATVGGEAVTHGNIYQWYGETIDDAELTGGYDYARSAGGFELDNIRVSSAIEPDEETAIGESFFLNGDFEITRQYSIIESDAAPGLIESLALNGATALAGAFAGVDYSSSIHSPGWSFHGGEGARIGDMCSLSPIADDTGFCRSSPFNPKLVLSILSASRRHNVQYVPQSATTLHFSTFTFDASIDDRLKVYFHPLSGGTQEIADVALSSPNFLRSTKRSASIEYIAGTSGSFEFVIESSNITIGSGVAIDDVGFEENRRYLASISAVETESAASATRKSSVTSTGASAYLGAYDPYGNYTGPTSDTSWVTGIPGSKFLIEDTAVTGGRHTIVLPALPDGQEYTFEVTSQGETGAVNLFIEDHATPGETGAAGFEAVDMSPSTTASLTIGNATTDPVLEVDEDGDGTTDVNLEPTTSSGTLPVELGSFKASQDGEQVQLTWATVSESGNAGFEVERQAGATDSFERIGYVEGAGTTAEAQTYSFRDADLPYAADSLVYRLRQVDVDGTDVITDEIALVRGGIDGLELLGTFPNPARSTATIRLAVPKGTDDARLVLYDVLGRTVQTIAVDHAGRQTMTLDTGSLASGIYFLRLTGGGQTRTEKVTVVR